MPRPKSKEELLTVGQDQFNKLWTLIDSMSDEEQKELFCFEDRDKNVRDVLVHLHEWHLLLLAWVNNNTTGNNKPFLPDGYNWKNYSQLNTIFWDKHQSTTLKESKTLCENTHKDIIDLLSKFTNEELFTKKYYKWTGTTSLGSYCVSTLSSHYDWALKKIKKHIKLKQTT